MLLFPAVLLLSAPLGLASEVPHLDYEATCRAARPLIPEDRTPHQTCVNDQTRARSELERRWGQFPTAAKGRCIAESKLGGSPSYVELLTCLELAQDAPLDPGAPKIERSDRQR